MQRLRQRKRAFDDPRPGDDDPIVEEKVDPPRPDRGYGRERLPDVDFRLPLTRWKRRVRGTRLDDDVWPKGKDLLRARLHRLHPDVRKHIRAACGLEHIVQESNPAARIDAAQREPLTSEHEERSRPRSSADFSANLIESAI